MFQQQPPIMPSLIGHPYMVLFSAKLNTYPLCHRVSKVLIIFIIPHPKSPLFIMQSMSNLLVSFIHKHAHSTARVVCPVVARPEHIEPSRKTVSRPQRRRRRLLRRPPRQRRKKRVRPIGPPHLHPRLFVISHELLDVRREPGGIDDQPCNGFKNCAVAFRDGRNRNRPFPAEVFAGLWPGGSQHEYKCSEEHQLIGSIQHCRHRDRRQMWMFRQDCGSGHREIVQLLALRSQ
jgi:hypothetical protein